MDAGVLLPAALAGCVAIGASVAVERLGGRTGGMVASLPSTIVPSAIGLYAEGDPAHLRAALAMVPVGMLLNAAFLWLWRVVPPRLPAWSLGRRLGLMTAISTTAWGAGAAAAVTGVARARAAGASPVVIGAGAWGVAVVAGLAATRRAPAPLEGRRPVPVGVLALRGLLAAAAIGGAITIARAGAPLVAGIASIFPAIYLTTMASLWLGQGEAVPAGAVGPMMLGSTSVGAFALLAIVCLPALGPWPGAAIAWLVSVGCVSLPGFVWLRRAGGAVEP